MEVIQAFYGRSASKFENVEIQKFTNPAQFVISYFRHSIIRLETRNLRHAKSALIGRFAFPKLKWLLPFQFTLFVHVLDARLVDQKVSAGGTVQLDAGAVVPLDDAV